MTSLSRHDDEIQANKRSWESKPLLREVYRDFYLRIREQIRHDLPGKIVELGSGVGNLRSVIPEAIATDLFPNPWINQVENAYHLSFESGEVSNLVMFDVFHHLEYPGLALDECHRVLRPGGRLILFEPAISVVGYLIYGLLHPEPVAWRAPITWRPTTSSFEERYYAAQGNATRIFTPSSPEWNEIETQWNVIRRDRFSALSYVLSGGFSRPSLYPRAWHNALVSVEKVLDRFPRGFATRIMIVLEKRPDAYYRPQTRHPN